MEQTNTNNITTYQRIQDIRRFLKAIQQISWDMGAMEKRYPIEKMNEAELDELLIAYQDLLDRTVAVVEECK